MKFLFLGPILITILVPYIGAEQNKLQESPIEKAARLSPWELHVVNDFFFEITLKKCPNINRPVASSLKNFITGAIKLAPNNDYQHPKFLENYNKLVSCFNDIDAKSNNPGKLLGSGKDPKDADDTVLNYMSQVQIPTTEIPTSNNDPNPQDKFAEWHWKWMNKVIAESFANIFRKKRDTSKNNLGKRVGIKSIEKPADAQQNFITMMQQMHQVVRNSCGEENIPDVKFSIRALAQIVDSVSKDLYSLVRASHKYFEDNSILDQLNECLEM